MVKPERDVCVCVCVCVCEREMHDPRQYFNENKLVRMIFLRLALSVLPVKVSRAAGMQFTHPLRMKIHRSLQQGDDEDDDDDDDLRITSARRRARPFDAKIMPPFRRGRSREYPRYCKATRGIERSRGKTMRMRECAVARSPSGNARTR